MIRKIVKIDEERCDGCGLCVPSCAEGAIQIVGGKARLSADQLCDGLGACLGECPRGALQIIERDAPEFDEIAVARHLKDKAPPRPALSIVSDGPSPGPGGGCPGSRTRTFSPSPRRRLAVVGGAAAALSGGESDSELGQWPIQLHLVSPRAPYFQGADLLIAADCVPFAYARFHEEFLAGRRVVVGCPKLDDTAPYAEKLSALVAGAGVRSVTVVRMEVPCCGGISQLARQAVAASPRPIPFTEVVIGIEGARKG